MFRAAPVRRTLRKWFASRLSSDCSLVTLASGRCCRGFEQTVWRPLTCPQFELPLRLRHEHLQPADREASFAGGGLEQGGGSRSVNEIEHDLAVERHTSHGIVVRSAAPRR